MECRSLFVFIRVHSCSFVEIRVPAFFSVSLCLCVLVYSPQPLNPETQKAHEVTRDVTAWAFAVSDRFCERSAAGPSQSAVRFMAADAGGFGSFPQSRDGPAQRQQGLGAPEGGALLQELSGASNVRAGSSDLRASIDSRAAASHP